MSGAPRYDEEVSVADTAIGVAMERALESTRSDALFHDPYAVLLAGPRGKKIARAMGRSNWPVTVRTRVLDDLLLDTISKDKVATVLNLGCGLDARPYRLDLPADLRWIEADVPETIIYKERILAAMIPRCRIERQGADLTDRDDLKRVLGLAAEGTSLVLTEGVLHYLAPDAVRELSQAVLRVSTIKWWILDVAHPRAVTWGRRATTAVTLWQFTPDNGVEGFRSWGWHPVRVVSGWEQARRYGRQTLIMRLAWALSTESRRDQLRQVTTYALLERDSNQVAL